MRKPLISFDSPSEYPTYCELVDCDHWPFDDECRIGKEPWECEQEAEANGEKLRELIRGEDDSNKPDADR